MSKEEHKCKYCGKEFETGRKLGGHTASCKENPKRKETLKKLKQEAKGKKLSKKAKEKISKAMKKAHKEGRAWNIGKSRWNNELSYPEKFFVKVINNEFEDKKYIKEYNISKYSFDFAWPHKKILIEIDGSQHKRFEKYKKRDRKKDKLAKEKGWKLLRISWKNFFNNTKSIIKITKNFVDNNENIKLNNLEKQILFLRKESERNKIIQKQKQKERKKEKEKKIKNRIDIIKNSGIDFSKFGWIKKVSELLDISHTQVSRWMKKYMSDFWDKCKTRK